MKTINSKLQKAGIESLTILAVMFVTCFTINAQGEGFENRFDNDGELALIGTLKTSDAALIKDEVAADMSYFAEFLEKENELNLTLESWMTDAAYFGTVEMETETEEALNVEDWMVNDELFKSAETEKEEAKKTEAVKTKKAKVSGVTQYEAQFGRRAFILVEMDDPKLELEQWMVDYRVWNR